MYVEPADRVERFTRFLAKNGIESTACAKTKAVSKQETDSLDEFLRGKAAHFTAKPCRVDALHWSNDNEKKLAIKRHAAFFQRHLPFFFAATEEGQKVVCSLSQPNLTPKATSEGGMALLGLDQAVVMLRKNRVRYFYLDGLHGYLHAAGSVAELNRQGLGGSELSRLLDVSAPSVRAIGTGDSEYEYEAELRSFAEEERDLFGAQCWMLMRVGAIMKKDDVAAEALAAAMTIAGGQRFDDAKLALMAYSTTNNMFLLEVGLCAGVDPDQPSSITGCRPISWAISRGKHAAFQALAPLTENVYADHAFLEDDATPVYDHALLQRARDYNDRKQRKIDLIAQLSQS